MGNIFLGYVLSAFLPCVYSYFQEWCCVLSFKGLFLLLHFHLFWPELATGESGIWWDSYLLKCNLCLFNG